MALSGDYFDSWFKRIDKQLQRADARTNDIVESQQVAAVADLISTGFAETQDKLAELYPWEAKINDIEEAVDSHLVETERTLRVQLDARFKKMESDLEDTRALRHNALCARGWQRVKPVGRRDGQGVHGLPPNVPQTVQCFWNLKDASKSKICVSPPELAIAAHVGPGETLTGLLLFCEVRGYQQWGQQSETAGVVSQAPVTGVVRMQPRAVALRAAIDSYPEIAHQALAMELGLDYDKIQANLERASVVDRTESGPSTSTVPSQGCKRERESSMEAGEVSSTSIVPTSSQPATRSVRIKIEK
ncbi:MAG: hypothetical protein LQ349_008509 [Xanthoria aureola]|nr:MAG: hypothetical protein LQ349_008509 [Xanthoria aureola]